MLQNTDISVWIDYKVAITHNKVMILDNQTIITVSFNFGASAQNNNAENVVILRNNRAIAQSYEGNFENRLAVSHTYQSCKDQGGYSFSKFKSKSKQ